ncbi:unnamed protein product [Ascophyllum nodosum]
MATVPVATVICLAVGAPYLWLGSQHYLTHGRLSSGAQSVLLFLSINLLICLWELCLCYKYRLIRSTHTQRVKAGKTRSTKIVVFRSMRLSEILSPSFWSQIWIDYSRFDPAYADSRSAGYNVDVCNGHSTLPPTLFLMVSMVWPIFGAKVTGMVALVMHYQMLYGSLMYFFSFFNNRSHKAISQAEVIVAVLCPTLVWVVFPLVGMYQGYRLIMEDNFSAWQ